MIYVAPHSGLQAIMEINEYKKYENLFIHASSVAKCKATVEWEKVEDTDVVYPSLDQRWCTFL